MSFTALSWVFVLAIALHNAEEALWLPQWSQSAGRWHAPVGPFEFRFAVVVLTVLAIVAAILAESQGKQSFGAYLLAGYALAMLLNVLVPHVLASIATRSYVPGTGTALLLNLPVTASLLRVGLNEGYVDAGRFVWAGPIVVVLIAGSIPLLFEIASALPMQKS